MTDDELRDRRMRDRLLTEGDFGYLLGICTMFRNRASEQDEPRMAEWWNDRITELHDTRRDVRDALGLLEDDLAASFLTILDDDLDD